MEEKNDITENQENQNKISYESTTTISLIEYLVKIGMERINRILKIGEDNKETVLNEPMLKAQKLMEEDAKKFAQKIEKEHPELTLENNADKIGELFEKEQEELLNQQYIDSISKLEQAGLETATLGPNPTDEEKWMIIQHAENIFEKAKEYRKEEGRE